MIKICEKSSILSSCSLESLKHRSLTQIVQCQIFPYGNSYISYLPLLIVRIRINVLRILNRIFEVKYRHEIVFYEFVLQREDFVQSTDLDVLLTLDYSNLEYLTFQISY